MNLKKMTVDELHAEQLRLREAFTAAYTAGRDGRKIADQHADVTREINERITADRG